MDNDHIEEIFTALGPVTIRRMFGGKGVYCDGHILAVVYKGELLLKADEETAPLFADAGAVQWAYLSKTGKTAHMPYWSIPDEALDDPDEMTVWARRAYEAALRAK
ncbi:TfoX/Sxy family protein [Gellertiella hungarica]|uniref:DNA transformation protein n=1 Tax=Gellertiella hungarica TaxID=1572859 RepID=A0A7W6J4J8_9HYPH|nr:DNA transformation protein [Gellertiella hungarica]